MSRRRTVGSIARSSDYAIAEARNLRDRVTRRVQAATRRRACLHVTFLPSIFLATSNDTGTNRQRQVWRNRSSSSRVSSSSSFDYKREYDSPPSPSPRPSSSPPDRASMFVASRNPRCLSESISSVRARARVSALLLVADELVARTLYSRMDYLCLLSRFTLRCVAQSTRLPVMNVSSPCVCLCISLKLDPGLRGARCAMRACERLVRFSSVLRAERTGNVAVAW